MKIVIVFMLIIGTIICGCHEASKKQQTANATLKSERPLLKHSADSGYLKESFNEWDDSSREYLQDALRPIRANFKRINSITKWSLIEPKELSGAEGGEALFYFYNDTLEKITTRYFAESGQKLTEYYLMNGALSFVFEKEAVYNRPFYYDSAAMKENHDSVCFDIKQSEIVEDRRYFKNNKIISQINNQDCGAPDAPEYILEEQKRVLADFTALMKLIKEK